MFRLSRALSKVPLRPLRSYSTPVPPPSEDADPLHYHILRSPPRIALSFLPTPPPTPTSSSILGFLPLELPGGQEAGLNDFVENKPFRARLQQAVRESLEQGEDRISAEASGRGEGWIHICDDRNYPMPSRIGEPEDLIGSVYVKDGKIDPSSYQAVDTYRILTSYGPPQPPGMMPKLLQVLKDALDQEAKAATK